MVSEFMPDALYPRLLGASWDKLAPAVQRASGHGAVFSATGTFRISPPQNALGRLMARWLRLPPPAEAAPAELRIERDGDRETWRRLLNGRPLVTVQRRDRHGRMVETFSGLELRMRVEVEDGGLVFRQAGAAVMRGRVPLPRFLAPKVEAREMPHGPDGIQAIVRVTMPLVGLLIAYDGWMTT